MEGGVTVNRRSTICGSRTPIARKLQKRVRLLHIFGARQGEKLDVSFGYMRDGNVTHYVQV